MKEDVVTCVIADADVWPSSFRNKFPLFFFGLKDQRHDQGELPRNLFLFLIYLYSLRDVGSSDFKKSRPTEEKDVLGDGEYLGVPYSRGPIHYVEFRCTANELHKPSQPAALLYMCGGLRMVDAFSVFTRVTSFPSDPQWS